MARNAAHATSSDPRPLDATAAKIMQTPYPDPPDQTRAEPRWVRCRPFARPMNSGDHAAMIASGVTRNRDLGGGRAIAFAAIRAALAFAAGAL
jgi:hypothetical protein